MSKKEASNLTPKFKQNSTINETFTSYEQDVRRKLSGAGFISEEINDIVNKLKSASPEIIKDRSPTHRPPLDFMVAMKDISTTMDLDEMDARRIVAANPYLLFEPWEDWKPGKIKKAALENQPA